MAPTANPQKYRKKGGTGHSATPATTRSPGRPVGRTTDRQQTPLTYLSTRTQHRRPRQRAGQPQTHSLTHRHTQRERARKRARASERERESGWVRGERGGSSLSSPRRPKCRSPSLSPLASPSLSAIAPRRFSVVVVVVGLPLSRSPPCLALLALALPLPALRRPYYPTPQIACIGASAGRPRLFLSASDCVAVACARQLGVIEECRVCYLSGRRRRGGVGGDWWLVERFLLGSPLAWCHWHWHCGRGREGGSFGGDPCMTALQ